MNLSKKVAEANGAAKDDVFNTASTDLVKHLDVLANDPAAAALWTLNMSGPFSGSATQVVQGVSKLGALISIAADGTVSYDASAYAGALHGIYTTDSFTYTVQLGHGALSNATVSINIGDVNDPHVPVELVGYHPGPF
jgi:hypothetical protein